MTAKEGKAACERIMALTPGDWYYDGNMKVRTKGTSAIIVDGISPFSPHGVANGYVLAASKDMLKALIEISPIVDTFINQTPSGEARNHLTDLNILIKSAIDKATKP